MTKNNELNVIMIGPRGVGKSSVLAAMHGEIKDDFNGTGWKFYPEGNDMIILEQRTETLRRLGDEIYRPKKTKGLPPTSKVEEFSFSITPLKGKEGMQLCFQDIPGEFYEPPKEDGSPFNWNQVVSGLESALASVIVVDAPYLMEKNGRLHDSANRPGQIDMLFRAVNAEKRRLVLFVPARCEKYIREGRADEMAQRIRDTYASLLGFLGQEELKDSVAVALIPVETVGALEFSHFDKEEPVFLKKSKTSKYAPKHCEIPLRFILRFLLIGCLEDDTNLFSFIQKSSLLTSLVHAVRGESKLREALKKVSAGLGGLSKTVPGFQMLQEPKWFAKGLRQEVN